MAKAVLIIDMPEQVCQKCTLCYETENDDEYLCGKKPDWCPLRELPEKKERRIGEHGERMFRAGFNACLNEIMRQGMSDSVD